MPISCLELITNCFETIAGNLEHEILKLNRFGIPFDRRCDSLSEEVICDAESLFA